MRTLKIALLGLSLLMTPLLAGAETSDMSQGEVRRIDLDGQRVTLRHGPINNLKMPPMTMIFRVDQKEQLEQLAPGDQVNFRAEERDGNYVVVDLHKQD
ncbi:copper-binding protein [Halopseudomonas salegens]|uniref:Cu and Ag efflux protein CusF n=1 Tax=Halopseudomonas salegens TaxID=1434072 RepID=A0A1H2DZ03_9GAMM|nr:copper-binding protein [Halopseudomonas salegens]SDT88019.1 Cu and Ag efflux protein CusF [Halopseudomonas salegens]